MVASAAIGFAASEREPRPAYVAACVEAAGGGLLVLVAGGSGVRDHADGEEVGEGVCDRLGRVRRVAVERADREGGVTAGLLGVVDQRWRVAGR